MTSRMDIWRSAKLLVDQYGADTPIRAAQHADELLAAGDIEGRPRALGLVLAGRPLARAPLTMCGRYSITTPVEALSRLFRFKGPLLNLRPRYNVSPTQQVPIVRRAPGDGERALAQVRWGAAATDRFSRS